MPYERHLSIRMTLLAPIPRCLFCLLIVLAAYQGRAQASPQAKPDAPQQVAPPAPDTKKDKKVKVRRAKTAASESANLFCDPGMPVRSFAVDATGNVNDTGRSLEGPVCVQVYFPVPQFKVTLSQATTTAKGPDATSVILGSAQTSGGGSENVAPPPRTPIPSNVSNAFKILAGKEVGLKGILASTKNEYNAALDDQLKVILAIKNMLQSEVGIDPTQMPLAVKNGYKDWLPALKNALGHEGVFVPSDRANPAGIALLPALQDVADQLALLKITFADGITTDAAHPPQCNPDLSNPETRNISFADWYAHCKDAYDTLAQKISADIQEAQGYASTTDKVTQLRSKLAIVKYWNSLFENIGLRKDMSQDDIDKAKIADAFVTATPVRCGTLFNLNSSTGVSVVSTDESPTLDGASPSTKTQAAFLTVTCTSPLSITAGIAFSTIEQKEFAIIKSAGGPNNTSVNKFGTINDTKFHPMPIGMVHVRLADWSNHKYAFHATLGVAGNIKGQDSGGSAAEFLPGISFSFWRTMYLSLGPHIGTEPALAGGFKEGDLVPSDVTSIQGLVSRSYKVGFGFAISFTKP